MGALKKLDGGDLLFLVGALLLVAGVTRVNQAAGLIVASLIALAMAVLLPRMRA